MAVPPPICFPQSDAHPAFNQPLFFSVHQQQAVSARQDQKPGVAASPELNPLCNLPGWGDVVLREQMLPNLPSHVATLLDWNSKEVGPDDNNSSTGSNSCSVDKLACIGSLLAQNPDSTIMPLADVRPTMNLGMWATPNAVRDGASYLHCSAAQFGEGLSFGERAAKFSFYGNHHSSCFDQSCGMKSCNACTNRVPSEMMADMVRVRSEQGALTGEVINERSSGSGACSSMLNVNKSLRLTHDHQPQEVSSLCVQTPPQKSACKRKRGVLKMDDAKNARSNESLVKCAKSSNSGATEQGDKKLEPQQSGTTIASSKDAPQKPKDGPLKPAGADTPPKLDYVHVRARRGQATDSHSLAERVRREKISERMKFLQDLVPGCNKITGKALMLDEIINYVQSLQRQVELLSMKLATIHPSRLELNFDSLLGKEDMLQQFIAMPTSKSTNDLTITNSHPLLHQQVDQFPGVGILPAEMQSMPPQTLNRMSAIDNYGDSVSQLTNTWEDDLQHAMHMSFTQMLPTLSEDQVKVEF